MPFEAERVKLKVEKLLFGEADEVGVIEVLVSIYCACPHIFV